MPEKPLPEAARHLVLAKIASVWHLEILLQLFAARSKFLPLAQLATSLRIEQEPLLEQLRELQSRGLAVPSPSGENAFAYFSASPEQDQAVAELAETYRSRPVSIINLIYSRPAEKIRTFADAFRLRQDKEPNE